MIDRRFRFSRTYRFYKAIEPVLTRSAVLRLAFNAFKVVSSGNWPGVVLDKFARLARVFSPAPAQPVPPRPPGLPELSRAILRELARDPKNVLVIQTPLAADLRRDIDAAGIPVIDLGACLESLRAAGHDPTYWPVTKMEGHWNHEAHILIGRFLAGQILDRHLAWPGL